MSATQGVRITTSYAPFYDEIALYPQLGKFRRFVAQWAKKVYDDTEEVLESERAVNDALREIRSSDSGVTILDLPRSVVKKEHPELEKKWTDYEESLKNYAQSLLLSEQILKLPHHSSYATNTLSRWQIWGSDDNNDLFGPTGEHADVYRKPSHRTDTCAWRPPQQDDLVSALFTQHPEWFERNIFSRLRRLWTRRRVPPNRTDIRHDKLVAVMDIVACVFVPLLLTAVMFVLVSINLLKLRIGIVGIFGLVFSLSFKAIAGHPSRGEVFAATAAFFAVASVFVSNTDGNNNGFSH